jgi:hypothetical protein
VRAPISCAPHQRIRADNQTMEIHVKKIMLVALLFFFTACSASAQKIYDADARNLLSTNDIHSFVYRWVAGFDHQKEVEYFTAYLPPDRVDMAYPEFPIRSADDFRRWYRGVEDTIQTNSHTISDLKVDRKSAERWSVSMRVDWKARTYEGENHAMATRQNMELSTAGGVIKILRHRAVVEP